MENIFLKLLNMSINASWLILAIILLRLLLRKSPRWIFCLLWAFAAFRLMCPFSLESAFSVIPSREPIPRETFLSPALSPDGGAPIAGNAQHPVPDTPLAQKPETRANPRQFWMRAAGAGWAMGTALMLLYALAGYMRLYRQVRTAVRLEGRVYASEFIDTPFILGVLRPRICLPSRMPEEMRAPVIAHEQAHLARLDHIWKVWGYALLAVYWFQPLCWIAYALFCRDLELACDEKVIRGCDSRQKKAYSEALLACSVNSRSLTAYPLAFGEVGVKERIKSVLNYKKPAFWAVTAATVVCAAAAVCFLTDPVEAGERLQKQAEAPQEKDGNAGRNPEGPAQAGRSGQVPDAADGAGQTPDSLARAGLSGQEQGGTAGAGLSGQNQNDTAGAGLSGQSQSGTAGTGLSGQNQNAPAGTGQAGQTSDDSSEAASLTDALRRWSTAFVSRDGETIAAMASEELAADLRARDLLSGPAGSQSFGQSSPWPADPQLDVSLYSYGSGTAEILYYAWDSTPHVTVWKERLTYAPREDDYLITSQELIWLDDISSGEAFAQAYGSSADLDGTRMDYAGNGAGETLNWNVLISAVSLFRTFGNPEKAAVELLNLSEDPSKVQITRISREGDAVNLRITFPQDDTSVQLRMIQPFGSSGIWVPQTYRADALYRLSQTDWDEIRDRRLSPYGSQDWTDIVCLARIPAHNIALYGYNDEEIFGQGTAIEFDGEMNFFDWIYTSPQTLLPDCYWDEARGQLQTALNIYTGTGISAQELHVLKRLDTGILQDNVFPWEDFTDALWERITFRYDRETGLLTLLCDQKTLAEAELSEEHVEGLELGSISRFVLGEKIFLQVEPGYYLDSTSFIAEYEHMPTLEGEVLLQENASGISFTLGEIRAKSITPP